MRILIIMGIVFFGVLLGLDLLFVLYVAPIIIISLSENTGGSLGDKLGRLIGLITPLVLLCVVVRALVRSLRKGHGEMCKAESTKLMSEDIDPCSEDIFNNRTLCSDGNCIGIIGSDGRCSVCGKRSL